MEVLSVISYCNMKSPWAKRRVVAIETSNSSHTGLRDRGWCWPAKLEQELASKTRAGAEAPDCRGSAPRFTPHNFGSTSSGNCTLHPHSAGVIFSVLSSSSSSSSPSSPHAFSSSSPPPPPPLPILRLSPLLSSACSPSSAGVVATVDAPPMRRPLFALVSSLPHVRPIVSYKL